MEAEPMMVIWWSVHECPPQAYECARTGNSGRNEPLKAAPRCPGTFPVLFVTQSPPNTLTLMYLLLTVLIIGN